MYTYRRYLGQPTTIAGQKIGERTVFGFSPTSFVLPGVAHPIAASEEDIERLTRQSRPFKADPSTLFNFKEVETEVAKPAKVREAKKRSPNIPSDVVHPKGVEILDDGDGVRLPTIKSGDITFKPIPGGVRIERDKPEPTKVTDIKPSEILKDVVLHKTEKPVDLIEDAEYDTEVPQEVERRIQAELDTHTYHKKDIRFNSGILMGGTASNYKAVKLTPFGGISLKVDSILDNPKYRPTGVTVSPAPDYVMKDFVDNVSHALGLKVPLPFQRLAFGYTNEGTMIVTRVIQAQMYGIILVDGKQIERLMGGFNSRTMAQAITHELAHFIDNTMLRNVERMKWQAALRGKNLHPDQGSMGARTTSLEHFATLAELMVWGNSLRRVYNLNGIDIVSKYFLNRYISEETIQENIA